MCTISFNFVRFNHLNYDHVKHILYDCNMIFMIVYMILVYLALLQPSYANCLPLAILKLLEECAMLKIGMIGLTPHHGTNYK